MEIQINSHTINSFAVEQLIDFAEQSGVEESYLVILSNGEQFLVDKDKYEEILNSINQ